MSCCETDSACAACYGDDFGFEAECYGHGELLANWSLRVGGGGTLQG